MFIGWTDHLALDKEKEDFENTIRGSKRVLDRLIQIVDKEYNSVERAELSHKIYEAPNWDYKIAHTNGYKAALKYVKQIIDLDQRIIKI